MPDDYNQFWRDNIAFASESGKRYGWFRHKRYAVLARVFPRFILKRFPARKYYRGVASLAEGFFCDLGCGLGSAAALYYALRGEPAIGVDISSEAISFAFSEKHRLHFAQLDFAVSDVFHTPFRDNLFDTAYLGQVLEHIPDEHKSLREAQRILKPGGLSIITVPKGNLLLSPYHLREYTEESLKNLLRPYATGDIQFYDFDSKRFAVTLRIKKD